MNTPSETKTDACNVLRRRGFVPLMGRRLIHVRGLRDESLLGITPKDTAMVGERRGAASLAGPAQFEVAFPAQVRMCRGLLGGQVRLRDDKRRLKFAFRLGSSPAGVEKGTERLEEFGFFGD